MFIYTKISILITVLSTIFTGYWIDQSTFYFPVEISRTATGPIGQIIFPFGALCSFIIGITELSVNITDLYPFLGFLILTIIDDKKSRIIHMIGVLLMIVGVGVKAFRTKQTTIAFGLIMSIYFLRIIMKGVVLSHHGTNIFNVSKHIMYTGETETQTQLLIFKLCGVLQWVALYGLIELHTIEKNKIN